MIIFFKKGQVKKMPLLKGQKTINQLVTAISEQERGQFKQKFEMAYFVCKERLPLSKYKRIIKLEENLHGLDIEISCANCQCDGIFIDYMGEALAEGLNGELTRAKFFHILWNGTIYRSILEQEVTFALYFDPLPEDRDTVAAKTSLLQLRDVNHGN